LVTFFFSCFLHGLLVIITALRLFAFAFNTLRTGSFKLLKRPLPGFLTILTL
jgi:hypothetical protein